MLRSIVPKEENVEIVVFEAGLKILIRARPQTAVDYLESVSIRAGPGWNSRLFQLLDSGLQYLG